MIDRKRFVLIAAPVLGCWWAWGWFAGQALRAPEALLGVVPLMLFGAFLWRDSRELEERDTGNTVPIVLIVLATLAWMFTTPLIAAGIAFLAAGSALTSACLYRSLRPAEAALIVAALPATDAVQFYFGFPLRAMVAEGAAVVLNGGGLGVAATGALLEWRGRIFSVDAACSGLSMLWTGWVLAAGLATWHRMNTTAALVFAGVAVVVLLAANVLRVAALFMAMLLRDISPMEHELIGLVVFGLSAFGLVWCAALIARRLP